MDEDKKKEQFCIPTKEVKSVTDLMRWEKSEGYQVNTVGHFNLFFIYT